MIVRPILLAEDSEHDAILFKHQLITAKIFNPLHVVTDGAQVIDYLDGLGEFADRSRFPLPVTLFLDLRMPKIGGYQILSFLQANPAVRDIPVIVLSVLGDIKDVSEAYLRGAKTFLIKPLTAPELLQTLRGIPGLHLQAENDGFILERTDQSPLSPGPVAPADPSAGDSSQKPATPPASE